MIPKSGSRLQIGLITNRLYTQVFEAQWRGVVDAARDLGVHLVSYPGGALQAPAGFEKQSNFLYHTINPALFDGLILWTGAIDWYVDDAALQVFVDPFLVVPLVSMETAVSGAPTITIDNYQGMWDLVQHLIVVHQYQRIAFIGGPAGHRGMKDRQTAYGECLQGHGLAYDAELIVSGDFSVASGKTAVAQLLDERGKAFDALVVANDKMAVGAIEELQARGIHVPLEKAVVGFDQDQTTFPPLTTVYPPFYEMGHVALETCVALIQGRDVPDHIEMPAELVIGRSCGCLPKSLAYTLLPKDEEARNEIKSAPISQQIAADILSTVPSCPPEAEIDILTRAFAETVSGSDTGAFLRRFDEILWRYLNKHRELAIWRQVLSVMRLAGQHYWRSPAEANAAEELCYQANLLVMDTERWTHEYESVVTERTLKQLQDIGDQLVSAFGLAQFKDLMMTMLPKIGICCCAIALYEAKEVSAMSHDLLLAFVENGRSSLDDDSTWQSDLTVVPPPLLSQEQPQNFIVAPLHFQTEQLGLVVFDGRLQKGIVYESLRSHLSSALKRMLLLQEIKKTQEELEKRADASTAELRLEIRERQQTTEALRKNEATMRALLEAIPDAIFLMDEECRFLNFIPAEGFKTAVSPQDYLGLTLADVFPPELAQHIEETIPKALHAKGIRLQEIPVVIGSIQRVYESRLMAVGQNVLGIIRDISARKENEAAREQLIQELETKNAELERFTYTVSHDLKSPLVTIKGFLGYLVQDVQSNNVDHIENDISRIRQAAEQMQTLLDDLLELSRVGRLMDAHEWVPLAQIIRDALSRVEGQIVSSGVEIQVQPDLPTVFGDHFRLVEVIQNLVDNAIKYMGPQPHPHITIGAVADDREIRIFVQDNGMGIKAQYHKKIFGLFNRLDQSTEGTGVGLALVKRIVELHDGQIWVESGGEGQGSVFTFTLPVHPQN